MNSKRLRSLFLFFFTLGILFSASATEIWVASQGSDTNTGSKSSPLATVHMALRKARELRRLKDPAVKSGIRIIIMDGTFYLDEPIVIRPEDSGTLESPTTIEADVLARPVLSGGLEVTRWRKAGAINGLKKGTIWVADAPQKAGEVINFRQLWVNGEKAVRAKSTPDATMDRILSWDKKTQSCWIPFPDKSIRFEPGMEMFIQQWWAVAALRIKQIKVQQDSARVYFEQPESRVQSEHPWPAPWISKKTGNSAFFLNNAISLLNEPGEWYLDRKNAKIYYYPKASQTMQSLKVTVPVLEKLVELTGTIDFPVQHISFKGISFAYSNWLRPSQNGHVPLQAGMYLLDAYSLKIPGTPDKAGLENQAWIGRPTAAVTVNYANHTQFEGCRFEHLSSTGLDFHRGTHHNRIQGNLFKDIGGSAINMGVFSDEAFETHRPYLPKDLREVTSDAVIADNLITNVTNEDWGTLGISAGFVSRVTMEHNEISDVSYSGIAMGWGWTKSPNVMSNNKVIANKIHHYAKHLYDVAAIYTLSAQPQSVIADNYIDHIYRSPYAHDPQHWFYLYTDEGSASFTVKNNWVPAEKFLQNANGPDNVWTNNNAFVGQAVQQKAGIRSPYAQLLQEVVVDAAWPLQEVPHYAAVELIGTDFSVEKITSIAKTEGVIEPKLYQWNNHLVLYAQLNAIENLKKELAVAYPAAQIKTYDQPVYNFSNFERCPEVKRATEWEHVVLTANLVADEKKQQQYLEAHQTQFEKWPEIAKGFCNADFQQVQVFKNAAQLMLVISIPKGSSLDELNPKTTANNPRVNDWNALMKKYQTGIEGTKPGEVWVILKKIN